MILTVSKIQGMGKAIDDKKLLLEFGKKVQSIRKGKNISQEELADLVSTHRTYIGMIERGERNPTVTTVQKIANALGVGVSDLLPSK